VSRDYERLLEVIKSPERLSVLSETEWDDVLVAARQARLSGRVVAEVARQGIEDRAPAWLRDRLSGTRAFAGECERSVRWEINRISRAFLTLPHRWVLLKGAAYVAADLPPARGRLVADVDVLVPHEGLKDAESALTEHGWAFVAIEDYDDRYYREWMHELPPMAHSRRGAVIDLHHAILPRTSRITPDTRILLERAVRAGDAFVLCPTHMVLHAAVHLFHDGEIAGALRDLVDLDALLRHFGQDPAFWTTLAKDARELGVGRPLYYSLRYTHRVLGTPIPGSMDAAMKEWAPPAPVRALMDVLVGNTLGRGEGASARFSAIALYVRSHWLRMPPLMLMRHLTRKFVMRKGA